MQNLHFFFCRRLLNSPEFIFPAATETRSFENPFPYLQARGIQAYAVSR